MVDASPRAIALVALTFIVFAYAAFRYLLSRTRLSLHLRRHGFYGCPHYRHTDFIFGSDYAKASERAAAQGELTAWHRNNLAHYGPIYEVNNRGKRVFHTGDTKIAQFVLATEFSKFGIAPSRNEARKWLGNGVFTADGEIWKSSRDLLKPIFLKAQISDLGRLDKHLSRLFDELAEQGYDVDLQPLFIKMYLEYSIDLLFGDDVNAFGAQSSKLDADAFVKACDESLLQLIMARSIWPVRWYYSWSKTWDRPFRVTQSYVEQQVQDALRAAQGHGVGDSNRDMSFVDHLVQQTGIKDQQYLRNQMLNIFLPARDTIGISLGFIFFQLVRHPLVYENIRHEVLTNYRGDLTYNIIKGLKYTNAVVNETLRLYTPASILQFDVLADAVLPRGGGTHCDQPLFLPRGAAITVHLHAISRDPSLWGDDADVFRPERWFEVSSIAAQRRAWEYLPFGGGPRICPAQAMVVAQLAYVLAKFALKFREVQNRDPEQKFVERHRILMSIQNGALVRLVPADMS